MVIAFKAKGFSVHNAKPAGKTESEPSKPKGTPKRPSASASPPVKGTDCFNCGKSNHHSEGCPIKDPTEAQAAVGPKLKEKYLENTKPSRKAKAAQNEKPKTIARITGTFVEPILDSGPKHGLMGISPQRFSEMDVCTFSLPNRPRIVDGRRAEVKDWSMGAEGSEQHTKRRKKEVNVGFLYTSGTATCIETKITF